MVVNNVLISFFWDQVLHINILGRFFYITVKKHNHLGSFDALLRLQVQEHVFSVFSYFKVFLLNATRFEHINLGIGNLILIVV